jgi:hypothetical protein
MSYSIRFMVVLLALCWLTACGTGGGGGGSDPTKPTPSVTVKTTHVELSGIAAHPDGGVMSVTVDNNPATVTGTTWNYSYPMPENSATAMVRMYRDGKLLSVRQLAFSRNKP